MGILLDVVLGAEPALLVGTLNGSVGSLILAGSKTPQIDSGILPVGVISSVVRVSALEVDAELVEYIRHWLRGIGSLVGIGPAVAVDPGPLLGFIPKIGEVHGTDVCPEGPATLTGATPAAPDTGVLLATID
jgi:hypothetical protein